MATLESVNKATSKEARLLFVDNIRWLMIVLVICHHSAVTYSHVGSWYYMDPAEPSLVTRLLLATFETFNQAYFMGFLFLIAGYFVPRAYDLKRRRSVSGSILLPGTYYSIRDSCNRRAVLPNGCHATALRRISWIRLF